MTQWDEILDDESTDFEPSMSFGENSDWALGNDDDIDDNWKLQSTGIFKDEVQEPAHGIDTRAKISVEHEEEIVSSVVSSASKDGSRSIKRQSKETKILDIEASTFIYFLFYNNITYLFKCSHPYEKLVRFSDLLSLLNDILFMWVWFILSVFTDVHLSSLYPCDYFLQSHIEPVKKKESKDVIISKVKK